MTYKLGQLITCFVILVHIQYLLERALSPTKGHTWVKKCYGLLPLNKRSLRNIVFFGGGRGYCYYRFG